MKRPRSLAEAELIATLIPGNVQAHEEPRDRGIGAPELVFALGFLMVAAGLALVWVPLAFLFAGGMLAFLAWRLA